MPALPPAVGAVAANPYVALATQALSLFKNDGGAAAAEAQQPGLIAAQRWGLFGDAHSDFLGRSSTATFQNQSPFFLASTQADNLFGDATVKAFFNTISPSFGGERAIPWGWIALAVILVLFLRRK